MKKIILLISAITMAGSLFAQEANIGAAEETKVAKSIEVSLGVASTYIWRGSDVYAGSKAKKDRAQESAFTVEPLLMPTVTIYAPLEGLSFNIWGAFATTDRSSSARGGADLRTLDELDYTMSYEFENKVGSFIFAYIYYAYPTSSTTNTYGEINFAYTAPIILKPTFGMAVADKNGGNTHYLTLGISHEIESGSLVFEPGLTFGYWLSNGKDVSSFRGHLELGVPLRYTISDGVSVHLTPLVVYRALAKNTTPSSNESKIGTTNGESVDRTKLIAAVTIGATYSY